MKYFGKSGLDMLGHDPRNDSTQLYLVDAGSREAARNALHNDIPEFVSDIGSEILLADFYTKIFNETPAHSDNIQKIMIDNPDVVVITESGGKQRKPHTIKPEDTLKRENQLSIFSLTKK